MSKAQHILDLQAKFGADGNLLPGVLPQIPQGVLPAAMTSPLAGVKQVVSFEEAQQPSSDSALNDSNRWMSQGNGLSSPNYWPSVNAVRVNRVLYTNGVGATGFPGSSDSDFAHEPIFTIEKRTIGQEANATVFTAGGLSGTSSATQILTPIDLSLAATEEIGIRWTSGARPAQVHLEVETTGGGAEVFYDPIVSGAIHARPMTDYNLGFAVIEDPATLEISGFFYAPPLNLHPDYTGTPSANTLILYNSGLVVGTTFTSITVRFPYNTVRGVWNEIIVDEHDTTILGIRI